MQYGVEVSKENFPLMQIIYFYFLLVVAPTVHTEVMVVIILKLYLQNPTQEVGRKYTVILDGFQDSRIEDWTVYHFIGNALKIPLICIMMTKFIQRPLMFLLHRFINLFLVQQMAAKILKVY